MTFAVSSSQVMAGDRPAFRYRHVVSFEETNVVGNVYFTHQISWQGRCREMFLKENAPEILEELARDLRLVTLRVSCDYYEELHALDEVEVRLRLAYLRQHKIGLDFEIVKQGPGEGGTCGRGFQEIACMRTSERGLLPVHPPLVLVDALKPFAMGAS